MDAFVSKKKKATEHTWIAALGRARNCNKDVILEPFVCAEQMYRLSDIDGP
jgi:hypothetical protein